MKEELALRLLNILEVDSNLLSIQTDRQLIKDAKLATQRLSDSAFRIAVFAPFNFGKSTLLNALLGSEILPTKVTRSTGTAITIKYGKEINIVVVLTSGEQISSRNPEILREFATLDRKGYQRSDVVSVEVLIPHPLLKKGVEILDLPGTNDKTEQDSLVRDQLLKVDLVVQVLNAKQPFTLQEQENLHQWLADRGMQTVVFVVNWLNQLESDSDRREVLDEINSITKDFKSDLPIGITNLYRVDALPAFKARQRRDIVNIYQSGLANFEASLYTIIQFQKQDTYRTRLSCITAVVTKIRQELEAQKVSLLAEIKIADDQRNTEINRGKQRENFFKDGFINSILSCRTWLSLKTLLILYQDDAALALRQSNFKAWENDKLKADIYKYVSSINSWVEQACKEFNEAQPAILSIPLPNYPSPSLPTLKERGFGQKFSDFFTGGNHKARLQSQYNSEVRQAYNDAIRAYLSEFSKQSSYLLTSYQRQIEPLINFPIPSESPKTLRNRNHLKSLMNSIEKLELMSVYPQQMIKANRSKLRELIVRMNLARHWLFGFLNNPFRKN
ncbi:MAG: dynamin family protein [Leptolyngbya sp. UWPOB_LEPTO1]|uniref:dynamin family protein n=1 Tax=Leptolyngbya sp. UWPOB_LEPTO1 TaxID=2815653 RepID=UPI001AD5878D|nr:dynamin family protein [Leptolyngbya sp. UWPOB_LEPTO1]MBN8559228.1 dynamin family protein [Leptolyngbya sp. UWPOB_LEPTO1]